MPPLLPRLLLLRGAALVHASGRAAERAGGSGATGRHAHWVLRTSDLKRSLDFYRRVLGMRVLRHEENPQACPITCNGRYAAAWSKTMVGFETEDRSYALELTFNYGVGSYPAGEALRSLALRPRAPPAQAVQAAQELGYAAESTGAGWLVTGPDDYRYLLLNREGAEAEGGASASEAFDHVRLRVRDVGASVDFYVRHLGMNELPEAAEGAGVRAVGYGVPGNGSVPLLLEPSPGGVPVRVEQWEGRHAVTLPAAVLRDVYQRLEKEAPWLIVHELRELEEQLGTLLIAIVRDPDGMELCLVSAEVFDAAVLAAADFAEPDWEARQELAAGYKAEEAEDGIPELGAPRRQAPPWIE